MKTGSTPLAVVPADPPIVPPRPAETVSRNGESPPTTAPVVPGNSLRNRWRGGPRERLLRRGAKSLSDADLVALLFGTGSRGASAVTLAERVLASRGLSGLAACAPQDLCLESGMGPARAAQVAACVELGRRLYQADDETSVIRGPEDVHAATRDLRTARKEHFLTFYLNARNQVIARETVSIGSLNASIVHPREVYEPAVRYSAASVVLVHNHPSGETDPSDDDLALTRRLIEVGELLGISVVDHVIVGRRGFTSLKQKGLI